MLTALLLSFAMSVAAFSGGMQEAGGKQEGKDAPAKPPKRGDAVVVKGCIRGGVVESGSLSMPDGGEAGYADIYTYRLTGEKKTLDEIRKEHDGHHDIITGELRTDLPRATRGRTVGNTRITIGVGSSRDPMRDAPPPMPVLKVASIEHTEVRCR